MEYTTNYSSDGTLNSAVKFNNDKFHQRLQTLYPCIDDISKLPQIWSAESRAPPIGLTADYLGAYFRTHNRREEDDKSAAAIRADHPIPPSCLLYYFEIKIISKGKEGFIGIGLSTESVLLTKLPGWAKESYGYHADDGHTFNGDGKGHQYGPTFSTNDIIGCGYNLVEGKCFFTKNGLNLGVAFDDIPTNKLLYPTIGLKTPGEEIKANFGQEKFKYDIEQDLRSLRKQMTLTISNYPINDFSDWQTTLHKLVQSWLFQNSYPNTAEAFTRSTNIDCKENMQRIQQRYRIQQSVLNGKISEAIRLTNRLCPNLLQSNPNLLFALKCRQFVELISGAEHDYQPIFNYAAENSAPSNGHVNGDQSPNHSTRNHTNSSNNNNGCNGMIINNNGDNKSITNQHSASSTSLAELMDIDQPPASSSINNTMDATNHHRSSASNDNHLSQQSTIKSETNGITSLDSDHNEQKYARLLHFGRGLSDYSQQLDKMYGKNETNEKMLQDTISLIAFTNPKKSHLGKLLDPIERESISQLLNSSIVKSELGDSYRPPLEEVMSHLKNIVRLNNSHGGWLIERLYQKSVNSQNGILGEK